MSAPRLAHIVDTSQVDLDMAIALGLEVMALCEMVFVPRCDGSAASEFPDCVACNRLSANARFTRSRGSHRLSTDARSKLPHFVYRCYDTKGRLLYIGCSYTPVARLRQHRAEKKPWVGEVARTRFTVFPDRRKALDMERLAIETEDPIHNRQFKRESA